MGKAKKVVDKTDGVAYTKAQFVEHYGEKKAEKIFAAAEKTAAAPEAKANGKARGLKAKKVVDKTDGVAYTKAQFVEHYGEKKAEKIFAAAEKGAAVPEPKAKAKAKVKAKAKPEKKEKKGAAQDKPDKVAKKIELYTTYKCPFARRALIAMDEKTLSFDFITIPLSGELKKLDEGATELEDWEGKSPDELRKIKADYKNDINATGEVPTLVVDGTIIKEADVIVEYLQDAFPRKGSSLMPRDALQRSKIRHYLKILGGPGGVSGMYGLLMNQDPAKDEEIRKKVYAHWASFAEMAGDDGPYFCGKTFSIADVMLMPMYDQFAALWPHYRGTEFIPSDSEAYPWAARAQKWADAVKERDSFKKSSRHKDKYIELYPGYAGARGAAKFGV